MHSTSVSPHWQDSELSSLTASQESLRPGPAETDGNTPNLVITGVTETPVKCEADGEAVLGSGLPFSAGHLDWLAVTFHASVPLTALLPKQFQGMRYSRLGRGRYGYRNLYQNELGVTVLQGGEARLGMHLVAGGEALENLRRAGCTDRELCQYTMELDGNVARLDLAIDAYNFALTVKDIAVAYEQGRLVTTARRAAQVERLGSSEATFYLGSRSSDRFFRAYNKGAQQGRQDEAWLRLELECKKLRARALTGAIATYPDTRPVINAAIADFVAMPDNQAFTNILAGGDVDLPQVERKLTNTYRWLMEQVAPVLARYQFDHPDEDVIGAFDTVTRLALERMQQIDKEGGEN